MALPSIRLCGRMLFLILLSIQILLFVFKFFHKQHAKILASLAIGSIVFCAAVEVLFGYMPGRRRLLSDFFRGWQFYILFVLVPSISFAFGYQAGLSGKVLGCRPADKLIVCTLCSTPILLLLLLTTADDSFSSKSHKELVRNLSVLMVADLFDAIETFNNAFECSLGTFDVSTIFLVIGAFITLYVSSLQTYEYEFIEGVEGESNERIRYEPNVFRKIVELATNLVVLTIRLEVLIVHGKRSATVGTVVIFKNFIAIILSVMHISSLTPPRQALKDEG